MKLRHLILSLCALVVMSIGCSQPTASDKTAEEPVKEWAAEDIRDIPALQAKRGLVKNTDEATPGYVMFHASGSTSTYIANKEGEIVHEVEGDLSTMLSYLTDDGRFIRHETDDDFPTFAAGGQCGRIREYTWDGEMTWNFEYATENLLTHHDLALLPNGNVLAIAWEAFTKEECIAMGIDEAKLPEAGLWFDKIIEIEPTRPDGGNIVWEWRMWEHLVQDIDADKPYYGDVTNPRKVNLNPHLHKPEMPPEMIEGMKNAGLMTRNATVDNQGSDLTHLNAIFYNADLDQIAISSFYFNEIYVIDHSTTTEEASGSTGGKYGHGGDILYRWGNPQNYGRGGPEDQQLYHQHDIRWIPEGYPGAGNMMVFNNDIAGGNAQFQDAFEALGALQRPAIAIGELDNYSAVFELDVPDDGNGNYTLPASAAYGPEEPTWSYMAPDKHSFYAPFVSNAHRLKNGNTFINSGPRGRFFEVTPDGEIVWEYYNTYFEDFRMPDGSVPQPVGPFFFAQYRIQHLPMDHPGLAGKELNPLSPQPEPFMPPPPPPAGGDGH